MKYVTRRLLKFRPGSSYVPNVSHRDRGRRPHKCYENANSEYREHGAQPRAGWLIGESYYIDGVLHTSVVKHFWSRDAAGFEYDTTPLHLDPREYDYVLDWEVYSEMVRLCREGWFRERGFETVSVPNMLYRDGEFLIQDHTRAEKKMGDGFLLTYGTLLKDDVQVSVYDLYRMAYHDHGKRQGAA